MRRWNGVWALLAVISIAAAPAAPAKVKIYSAKKKGIVTVERVVKSEAEWQKVLTPEQFRVTRKAGTETAFTGKYWDNHAKGTYR
jgi:peptide-methionine (R)-S-oxide reductase